MYDMLKNMKNKITFLGVTLCLSMLLIACSPNPILDSISNDSSSESISTSNSTISTSTSTSTPKELPTPTNITISSLRSKTSSDSKKLYRITGYVQQVINDTYGNFDITDATGSILCWGLDANSNCFTFNGTSLSYSSIRSFSDTNVKPGDQITMVGWYVYYQVSGSYYQPEIQGYLESRTDGGVQPFEGKNYTTEETYSGTYYSSIGSETGDALATSLHNLMMTTHKTYVSYSSLDTTLKTADGNGSQAKCFYSGNNTSSFNKEHVWPQGKSNKLYGTTYAGSDIHHIRATVSSYNSKRGSNFIGLAYGPVETFSNSRGGACKYSTSGGVSGTFEPADSIKGDVARILMYVYLHYSTEVGGTQTSGITGNLQFNKVLGPRTINQCVRMLREWNANDPVSEEEINRNNVAFNKQGNRNPFIDHPSYADKIWGTL